MKAKTLEFHLLKFEEIARGDGSREPLEYLVDVFVTGGAGYNDGSPGTACMFTGKMQMPNRATLDSVTMELQQYGGGTDFGMCVIEISAIVAIRMKKPE